MKNLQDISGIAIRSNDEAVDITDLVYLIEFHQSIYEPFVTGSIVLKDSASSRLINMFKHTVIGKGEELSLRIKTKTAIAPGSDTGDSISLDKYYIYKVSYSPLLGTSSNNNEQAIVFHFSSHVMFINEFKKVHTFFSDTISNIVVNIANDYLGVDVKEVEESEGKKSVIIPNMNPIQAIFLLSTKAYSKSENKKENKKKDVFDFSTSIKTDDIIKNNNYVFYEDIEHNFYFKTIGNMFLQEPVVGAEGTDSGIVLSVRRNNYIDNYFASFAAIQMLTKPISPLSNAKNGMYASSLLTVDLTRKQYAKQEMKYNELFKTQNHFYDNQLIDEDLDPEDNIMNKVYDSPEMVFKYYPKSSYLFSPKENILEGSAAYNDSHDWLLQRIASMEAIEQEGMDIEIRGNVSINIGDVVTFKRQEYSPTIIVGFSKTYDNLFTGKYLITKIKHSIENGIDNIGYNIRTFLSLRRDCDYRGED